MNNTSIFALVNSWIAQAGSDKGGLLKLVRIMGDCSSWREVGIENVPIMRRRGSGLGLRASPIGHQDRRTSTKTSNLGREESNERKSSAVLKFTLKFKDYVKALELSTSDILDIEALALFQTFLGDEAQTWMLSILPQNRFKELTVDSWLTRLEKDFYPHEDTERAREEIEDIRQGKYSVFEYVAKFRRINSRLTNPEDPDMVQRFVRGLRSEYRNKLRNKLNDDKQGMAVSYRTFEWLISRAIRYETSEIEEQSRRDKVAKSIETKAAQQAPEVLQNNAKSGMIVGNVLAVGLLQY
ncbi:hypothetical protein HDV02_004290 [Globomyces sp. JEL0801]|nr:hypothetical protein HDV02_004290 [Globomyces sp. JEL0801]